MSAVPESMRAAVLFGPSDLRVVRKPVPRPGPGELLDEIQEGSGSAREGDPINVVFVP